MSKLSADWYVPERFQESLVVVIAVRAPLHHQTKLVKVDCLVA